VDETTPFDEVLRLVAASPYSRMPVYRGSVDTIVGILHIKDVVTRFVQSGNLTVASLLRPIVRVPDSMPADRLLAFLRERRSHQALVEDAAGAVVGLITLEDVLGELLGGVADEFKAPQARPIRLSDGRIRLPGPMRLEQASPLIGAAWSGSAETVGAHILQALHRLPEPGEEVIVDGQHVEIEAVDSGVIASVIVGERPTRAEADSR
jgi:CBS domain containing-hemolysin-like protein